jgi:hypothetical protein
MRYSCKTANGSLAKLIVTPSSKPLSYQNTNVVINKYDLTLGKNLVSSFYLYKFANKLHVLEGTAGKLNHTKDQVLFSIPHQESYRLNVPGLLDKSALVLMNYTTINGVSFYKYDVMSSKAEFNINQLIFDKDLDINELKFTAQESSCSCTKANITIRLRQR